MACCVGPGAADVLSITRPAIIELQCFELMCKVRPSTSHHFPALPR